MQQQDLYLLLPPNPHRHSFAYSIYVLGFGCIGLALALRAGDTGYLDKGVIQVSYILLLPSVMFAVAMVSESWVASLPSQVQ